MPLYIKILCCQLDRLVPFLATCRVLISYHCCSLLCLFVAKNVLSLGTPRWPVCFNLNLVIGESIFLFLVTPSEVLPLIVQGTETTRRLKELIEQRYGFPADMQRLTINSRILQENRTLRDYGYKVCSKLIVVLETLPQTTPITTASTTTATGKGSRFMNRHKGFAKWVEFSITVSEYKTAKA